jgi:DNA-binding NtrC family response regulator
LATQVQELCPETSVLMITAHRDATLMEEHTSGLIRSVLDKPVELEEIRAVVSEALGRSESLPDDRLSRTQEPAAREISHKPVARLADRTAPRSPRATDCHERQARAMRRLTTEGKE